MAESGRGRQGRRRVGDETRKRIEGLAEGWSVGDSGDTEPVGRADSEDERAETVAVEESEEERAMTVPLDSDRHERPLARPATPSQPPPIPADARGPKRPTPPPKVEVADQGEPGEDQTVLSVEMEVPKPTPRAGARPRTLVTLPRSRGVWGDIRYVFVAMFGVARARRDLVDAERELAHEMEERNRRLVAVARYAAGEGGLDHTAVNEAREHLAHLQDVRSRHAGTAAAAESEIETHQRERSDARDRYERKREALTQKLAAIRAELEPLEKQAAKTRRRADDLKRTLAELDRKLAAEEKALVGGKPPKEGAATVEARLAALRAEREQVISEEPELAAELDELEPKIASLAADRRETEQARASAEQREQTERERCAERIAAAEARAKVERNAMQDIDADRDAALLELGEQLDADRPPGMAERLRGADEHAMAIATLERRTLELTELVEGVDRWALVRGSLYLTVILAAIGAAVWLFALS